MNSKATDNQVIQGNHYLSLTLTSKEETWTAYTFRRESTVSFWEWIATRKGIATTITSGSIDLNKSKSK